MKHLLIIPSFILLSSPVIGQETGVLYQYETSSGIQWKTFGDGKVQPKYKGEIKNGKPNGQGIYTYPDGRKYIGQWKDGKINGRGTYTSPFRWKYVGEFKDGNFQGQGEYTLTLMEKGMWESLRTGYRMDREHSVTLTVENM